MTRSNIIGLLFVIALVGAIAGVFWYQNTVIESLTDRVSALSSETAKQRDTIEMQNKALLEIEVDTRFLITEISTLQTNFKENTEAANKKKSEYDSYRGRLYEVSLQKPTLIERRANSAFTGVMQNISRETGVGSN